MRDNKKIRGEWNTMENKKLTQNDMVLQYLRERGSITQLDALRDLGIMRLASRVSSLKRMGQKISSSTGTGVNMFGEKKHFAIYKFEEEKNG